MLKKILITLSILFLSQLSAESDFDRANRVAAESAKNLDCEFEECKPEPPKVIIKEKIVVKEKKVPVFIIKERVVYKDRPVEKVVVKEKIVYRDRPVVVEKVIIKEEILATPIPVTIYNNSYKVGRSANLSEIVGPTWKWDKSFVKYARSNADRHDGFLPFYAQAYAVSKGASLSLINQVDNYVAFITITRSSKDRSRSYSIQVGNVSFNLTRESNNYKATSLNSTKVIPYSAKCTFKVVCKGNIIKSYVNGSLIATSNDKVPVKTLSASVKNFGHYQDESYSEHLVDMGITELVLK